MAQVVKNEYTYGYQRWPDPQLSDVERADMEYQLWVKRYNKKVRKVEKLVPELSWQVTLISDVATDTTYWEEASSVLASEVSSNDEQRQAVLETQKSMNDMSLEASALKLDRLELQYLLEKKAALQGFLGPPEKKSEILQWIVRREREMKTLRALKRT